MTRDATKTGDSLPPLSDLDASHWRLEFPMLEHKIHVANCSHSPQSRRVRDAIERYLQSWLVEGMDWEAWLVEINGAKEQFARLIAAEPREIAITTSASAAVASIASSLDQKDSRRRVVTTQAEFPTVGHVWLAHQKYGLEVEFIPLRSGAIDIEDYIKMVSDKTIITSATHVYYKNGFKQDIKEISRIAHDAGSLLLVDAYQSLGTCAIDVRELDVDILVGGCLKYLLGIPGVAFIYVKNELIDRFEPALTGWFGRENPFEFNPRKLDYSADSRRLETGTPPIIAAAAAREGMKIISELGPSRIEARIRRLTEHMIQAIRHHDLDYAGTTDLSRRGAVTAIRVPDPVHAERHLRALDIVAAARGDVIRIAPHFFNTTDELERVIETLARMLKA